MRDDNHRSMGLQLAKRSIWRYRSGAIDRTAAIGINSGGGSVQHTNYVRV